MKIIVQKFGGTSVSRPEGRHKTVEKIKAAIDKGYRVVVVVSAMGRKGDPYATDTLIGLARDIHPDIRSRELDILLNCGEVISSVVMGQELRCADVDAVVLTGGQAGIITDDHFGEARIMELQTARILSYLEQGKVVVVAGFQGMTQTGELTTIGRGGSDTSATALGAALGAEVVEIYTDVDGIKTADPRIVEEAKTLESVSYQEARNLVNQGAKVIHPRAVEYAMRKNIPVRVRSTFTDDKGTLITDLRDDSESIWDFESPIMGITQMDGIAQLRVKDPGKERGTWEYRVFGVLAEAGVSVDFISVAEGEVIFTIKEKDLPASVKVLTEEGFGYEVTEHCAKISAIGTNMTEIPGIMHKLMEALSTEGIPVLQTADSNVTIWCLVHAEHMNRAVQTLHRKFQLEHYF